MTGNIIGEPLDPQLIEEINIRQKIHGSGFASKRNIQQIQFLNNRNAWFKLASSVEILNGGTETQENGQVIELQDGLPRLKEIGIENPERFIGNELAKKTVLFNLMSELELDSQGKFKSYVRRAGISNKSTLWNNSSVYGLGDNPSPSTPAPGIKDVKIDCINRGSIKKATVSLVAYNKFQFELIEIMYLRLGFSMMLEWGFNQYIDENNQTQQVGNTIIERNWFTRANATPLTILDEIKTTQLEYQFNYDAFYGKVVNFDWEFTPEGTYNITLNLITVGDVIESLTVTPSPAAVSPSELEENTQDNIEGLDFQTAQTIGNMSGFAESAIYTKAGLSALNFKLLDYIISTKWGEQTANSEFFSWQTAISSYNQGEAGSFNDYPNLKAAEQYNYFYTFRQFLSDLFTYCSPTIGPESEPLLSVDIVEQTSLVSVFPNLISLDPRVCLIKPQFQATPNSDLVELQPPAYLNNLKTFIQKRDDKVIYGNLMNIYLNFEFVASVLANNTSEEDGNLTIFKCLEEVCKGINRALGYTCKLQPIIKDDRIVTIVDQNPIPGLITEEDIPNIEVFGYNLENNTSNFVKDISFKTEITPNLAKELSIGATAGNSTVKETDGTAFSKWNEGLRDRFLKYIIDPPTAIKTPPSNTELAQQAWDEGKNISGVRKFVKKAWNWLWGDGFQTEDENNKTCKYRGYTIRDVNRQELFQQAQEVDRQIEAKKANERITMDKLEKQFASNFYLYLSRCFGGKVNVTTNNYNNQEYAIQKYQSSYTKLEEDFINEGIQAFKAYKTTVNNLIFKQTKKPSNQGGFIPVKLNLTMEGLSGVKIYNGIRVTTKVLPSDYNNKLKFIITGVNHSISDNDWTTSLETLSIPPTEPTSLNSSPFLSFDQGINSNAGQDLENLVVTGPISSNEPFTIIDNRGKVDTINTDGLRKTITSSQLISIINRNAQGPFRSFLNTLESEYKGYTMTLNAVYRDFATSKRLKRQNPRNASPGKSKHNYSAAIDFNITDPNGRTFRKKERAIWIQSGIVDKAKNAGLGWGGTFSNYVDSIHFFVQFNASVALQNAAEENQGKPQSQWDTQNTKLS